MKYTEQVSVMLWVSSTLKIMKEQFFLPFFHQVLVFKLKKWTAQQCSFPHKWPRGQCQCSCLDRRQGIMARGEWWCVSAASNSTHLQCYAEGICSLVFVNVHGCICLHPNGMSCSCWWSCLLLIRRNLVL
jgi:hypothetical protein